MKRRCVAAFATALLAACGGKTPPATAPAQSVPLVAVREGAVERTVALTGRIGAPAGLDVKLGFPLGGVVGGIYVRIGDRVVAGQPLAQLDTSSLALAAQQATADARAASAGAASARIDRVGARLALDESQLRRTQSLYDAGLVARKDVEQAQATVAADRAESQTASAQIDVASAQAQSAALHAESAAHDLSLATLRSSASGVVSAIYVQPGQVVDPAAPAVAIAPQTGGAATVDVPVASVSLIRPGQEVRVRALGSAWTSRIAGIGASVNPATGLAVAEIAGTPVSLPGGTPIAATVVLDRLPGLIVPATSIVDDPQTGKHLVFVASTKNGSLSYAAREVTIDESSSDGPQVRVLSGLRASERIAKQGAIDLLSPPAGGGG